MGNLNILSIQVRKGLHSLRLNPSALKVFKKEHGVVKCEECEGTGDQSIHHGGNCIVCDGYGELTSQEAKDDFVYDEEEKDWEAIQRGEHLMQEQRDEKYE